MDIRHIKEMSIKKQMLHTDKYCTVFVSKQIDAVKKYFGISKSRRVYALDWWCDRYYFLCGDKVYAVYFDYKDDDLYKPIISSAYIITLKNGEIADFETIKPDDTTPAFREVRGVKFDITRKILTKEFFKLWYDSPVRINEFVDVSHSKAIEFLQNYKKNTFQYGRYLFYSKRDNDLTWLYFIYAYDLKTKAEVKIYVDCYFITKFPEKLSEIYVKDLSGKLSAYQKLQFKKAFFEYSKQECTELKAPNFYALEFVKQCIQPIEKESGWGIDKPRCEDVEDFEIYIDDKLIYDEKPYFLVMKRDGTQIAALDFYKPEYKSTEPYINGYVKKLHWDMDKTTLNKLMKLLNKKYDCTNTIYYKQYGGRIWGKEYTNWQLIIQNYNENTGSREDKYVELPMDLPIPDYTKLLHKE